MCRLCAVVPRKLGVKRGASSLVHVLGAMMVENSRTSNKDGAGVHAVGSGQTFKKMQSATDMMVSNEMIEWSWANVELTQPLIGHTRLSTTGKGNPDAKNAHPFTVGNWTLAHNGHIQNWWKIKNDLKLATDVVVDSEVALHHLAGVFGEATTLTPELLQSGLDGLEGGYAFLISNSQERDRIYAVTGSNALHAYTNDEMVLINTDGGLKQVIDQALFWRGLYSRWYQATEVVKLDSNSLYVVTSSGLEKLGAITPKVSAPTVAMGHQPYRPQVSTPAAKSTTTTTTSGGTSGSTSGVKVSVTDNVISTSVLSVATAEINARIQAGLRFRAKYGLSMHDVNEMLEELHPVLPLWAYDLDVYQWEILEGWMEHLIHTKIFYRDEMIEMNALWSRFKASLVDTPTVSPYVQAGLIVNNLCQPYYLNGASTLRKLFDK